MPNTSRIRNALHCVTVIGKIMSIYSYVLHVVLLN